MVGAVLQRPGTRAERREAGDLGSGHGLKAAVRKVLKVEWQRCKVHFYRKVLVHLTKRSQAEVSEAMKAVSPEDEIAALARAVWKAGDSVEGDPEEDWFQAERRFKLTDK